MERARAWFAVGAVAAAMTAAALGATAAPPRDIADALAELKAVRVSTRSGAVLTLGADQVLVHAGRLHDKPADLAEAVEAEGVRAVVVPTIMTEPGVARALATTCHLEGTR